MISALDRRLSEVENRQTALENDQKKLRSDVRDEVTPLIAEMHAVKAIMQSNHEAVMSAWEDLTTRLAELLKDHREFHPGNGKMP